MRPATTGILALAILGASPGFSGSNPNPAPTQMIVTALPVQGVTSPSTLDARDFAVQHGNSPARVISAERLSGGMKRRLNFACGIVHQPNVLLLDEPTVGVDPQSRVRLLELTRDLARSCSCTSARMPAMRSRFSPLGTLNRSAWKSRLSQAVSSSYRAVSCATHPSMRRTWRAWQETEPRL